MLAQDVSLLQLRYSKTSDILHKLGGTGCKVENTAYIGKEEVLQATQRVLKVYKMITIQSKGLHPLLMSSKLHT